VAELDERFEDLLAVGLFLLLAALALTFARDGFSGGGGGSLSGSSSRMS
jgi:hypothetical protein